MIMEDDRTEEQKGTHTLLIGGTDRFLSGWGRAADGASYAFWACRPSDQRKVERGVRSRIDMLRVRIVGNGYRPNPRRCAHCQVYVVHEKHGYLQ